MSPNLDTAALYFLVLRVCSVVYLNTCLTLSERQRLAAFTLLVGIVPLVATAMTVTSVDPFPLLVAVLDDQVSGAGPGG